MQRKWVPLAEVHNFIASGRRERCMSAANRESLWNPTECWNFIHESCKTNRQRICWKVVQRLDVRGRTDICIWLIKHIWAGLEFKAPSLRTGAPVPAESAPHKRLIRPSGDVDEGGSAAAPIGVPLWRPMFPSSPNSVPLVPDRHLPRPSRRPLQHITRRRRRARSPIPFVSPSAPSSTPLRTFSTLRCL